MDPRIRIVGDFLFCTHHQPIDNSSSESKGRSEYMSGSRESNQSIEEYELTHALLIRGRDARPVGLVGADVKRLSRSIRIMYAKIIDFSQRPSLRVNRFIAFLLPVSSFDDDMTADTLYRAGRELARAECRHT